MKDIPDGWQPPRSDPGVEVVFARHGFIAFTLRAAAAFLIADSFRLSTGLVHTCVHFRPFSQQLVNALWACIEPGESINVGSQSITKERCKLQEPPTP